MSKYLYLFFIAISFLCISDVYYTAAMTDSIDISDKKTVINNIPYEKEIVINDHNFNGKVTLTRMKTYRAFRLELKTMQDSSLSSLMYKYDIYRLEKGDINGDGSIDVLIGIIKPARFDPVVRRRLFILQIDQNTLRPLWLGTKMCRELVDFTVCKVHKLDQIKTIEKESNGLFCIGLYSWSQFGLSLIKYLKSNITLVNAEEELNHV